MTEISTRTMAARTLRHAILMLFLALLLSAFAPAAVEFGERLSAFHQHYDLFLRAYLGCPKGAKTIEQCDQAMSTVDYQEFNRAAVQARELFGLEKK